MAALVTRFGDLLVTLVLAHCARISRRAYGGQIAPDLAGIPRAEEVIIRTEGVKLVTWHVPSRGERPIVIFFPGGTTPLRGLVSRFRILTRDGTGLLAPSYRGYGGSTGWPSEAALMRDATTVFDFVRAQYPSQSIVVWGYSLGCAIAVALAAEQPINKLILEAPFAQAADFVTSKWLQPLRALARNQLRSDQRIRKVTAPVLMLHGERDMIVPMACGRSLFALAPGPKRFAPFPQGAHDDLDAHGALRVVRQFLSD
jgi:pimeloyl-ACP methyl ester carboxylesterase